MTESNSSQSKSAGSNSSESNRSESNSSESTLDKVYLALTTEDEGRLCKDIPESACNDQPKHFITHVLSLSATKMADGFIDPKLILSWLLTQLGTSSFFIGLLVPIREAGALLPQLFTAKWIRERQKRKWVWAIGSLAQGLCVAGMIISATVFSSETAGVLIVGLLGLLAVARSFCSVSYKDVLGKTVSKSTRGTATGLAGSIASTSVIVFASLLMLGVIELTINTVLLLLTLASLLWIFASFFFLQLHEKNGSTENGSSAIAGIAQRIKESFSDRQFVLFILTRGLLIATALAPPFVLLLQQQITGSNKQSLDSATLSSLSQSSFDSLNSLGLFIFASSIAGLLSSYVWGKLADRSSRKVLMISALTASLGFLAVLLLINFAPHWLTTDFTLPVLLFVIMIAYQGVRLGRSTHLVDMADDKSRANYTAVSNTIIGLLLLAGSVFGWISQLYGLNWVFVIFLSMCLLATFTAFNLNEVQSH
ncbi:MAG: MFS transporter [Gammaproteobacteria bacterium]|nr:MFS transporter [Gammaproteobacteria bacterium]